MTRIAPYNPAVRTVSFGRCYFQAAPQGSERIDEAETTQLHRIIRLLESPHQEDLLITPPSSMPSVPEPTASVKKPNLAPHLGLHVGDNQLDLERGYYVLTGPEFNFAASVLNHCFRLTPKTFLEEVGTSPPTPTIVQAANFLLNTFRYFRQTHQVHQFMALPKSDAKAG